MALSLSELLRQEAHAEFGLTREEAHAQGICIRCKEIAAWITPAGEAEYRISGLCELCASAACLRSTRRRRRMSKVVLRCRPMYALIPLTRRPPLHPLGYVGRQGGVEWYGPLAQTLQQEVRHEQLCQELKGQLAQSPRAAVREAFAAMYGSGK